MFKYKIIISFFIFCFFYASPSISKNNCDANNNYIYYSDVVNDEYYKNVTIWKSGKGAKKRLLTNYSFIVKSADKDYEVEYIAVPEKEKKESGWLKLYGNFTATNLKTCKSKTYKFTTGEGDYNFAFLEASLFLQIDGSRGRWYRYTGMTCKNEQNPQCMKKLAEIKIIGYRDLKNNLTYAEFVTNYKKKVAEEKKIAEEKRIAEEKKRIEEEKQQEERTRIANEKRAAEELAQRKKYEEKKRIANLPHNRLYDAYTFYISIKKFYDASSLYYVSSGQMREAKSQIKAIEKILVEKDSTMNIDNIWDRAANKIDGDLDANAMSMAAANPTTQFQALAKIYILGLGDVYNKLIGPQKTEKDF